MSNTAASPGSRPLEQLKVAELRDELRKRGLSLKGVKKELFERLDEAVKKEEQEGIVYGEHEATPEGAQGSLDETEDVEGEGEVLDGSKGEASKSLDTAIASENNTLPDTPPPTTEESTPFPEETHALPGVSAPNEVPGSNEEREQLCTAGGANVGTNNDVLFVGNAACGNGDATLLPDSAANVADVLEPCKDTSGEEHVECEDDEKQPDIVIWELADSERVDVLPESGSVISVIENVVSDVLDVPGENGDTVLAVDNTVCANNASENDGSVHDVENKNLKGDQLSIPDSSVENPSLEAVDKSSMQPLTQALDSGEPVDMLREAEVGGLNTESLIVSSLQCTASQKVFEPHAGLKLEEPERHNGDERDLIMNEEKSDVKLEEVVQGEIVSEGGLEKSSVKIEPMEIEIGSEERHEAICEVKMELKNDKEDHRTELKSPPEESQLKEVRSDHDYSRKSRGEERARVPDDHRMDTKDDVILKAVDDDSQARINLKRKDSEVDVKHQEPAKRMRRWNSGKEVVVDALKPLTTDTMKEIMLPDRTEGSSVAAQRLTPKAVATSRALPAKVKVEPEPINNTRTVPPSTRAPSNSLKVEGFVRPFTLKAVKDLLAEFGQCVDFWMDQIKTHCFVMYSSVNEAVAARSGLYGRQWPPSVGNCLTAEFVDVNEVKIRSEGLAETAQAAPTAVRASNSTQLPPSRAGQSALLVRNDPNTVPPSRFSRDVPPPPAPKKDPDPAGVTLEDLFFKTKAKPHIYYLPLTDEQVAEKIKNKQAVR